MTPRSPSRRDVSGWSSCPTFSGVERCATACRLPRPLMSPHWLRRTWWPGGDLDIAPSQRKNGAGARRRHPRRAALRLKNISKGISCCQMLLSKLQNVTGTIALGHTLPASPPQAPIASMRAALSVGKLPASGQMRCPHSHTRAASVQRLYTSVHSRPCAEGGSVFYAISRLTTVPCHTHCNRTNGSLSR